MVSSISQTSGSAMFDLVGVAQNNMSLLKSQRESRRVNAEGIVCQTTVDPKYMLGALAARQGMNMLSNITEKATLTAADAALEANKKYIEEKAQEALAPDAEGTITDQLLEESAKAGEGQPENIGADTAPGAEDSPAPDSLADSLADAPTAEGNASVDTAKHSVDITV